MTQGFYEQLGVSPDADPTTLRKAYHRQVARLTKRTRQLHEQGGDTTQLELARQQLEEAWQVLSVPSRRLRYDVLLTFLDSEVDASLDAEGLWEEVGSDLVSPALAAATRLVARMTRLKLEPVGQADAAPAAPRPVPTASLSPTMVPATSYDTAFSEVATEVPSAFGELRATPAPQPRLSTAPPAQPRMPTAPPAQPRAPGPPPISLPTPPPRLAPDNDLRVVDGARTASPVIVLPAETPRQKTLSPAEVSALVDMHGYSGPLLMAVRQAKGVTLQEVADSTRISLRYLQAIEADAHDRLPSATFVRGYVKEIARILKLDEEAVVMGYMRRIHG